MHAEIARTADVDRIVALVNDAYRASSKTPGWTHETELLAGQRTDAAKVAAMLAQEDSTILVMRRQDDVRTGAAEPFPHDDATVGTPLRSDLALVTLTQALRPIG